MVPAAASWESVAMKNAARFLFSLALAGACLGWIPQQKGKRKLRMACADPVTTCQPA
jgi:hypothetical protein